MLLPRSSFQIIQELSLRTLVIILNSLPVFEIYNVILKYDKIKEDDLILAKEYSRAGVVAQW